MLYLSNAQIEGLPGKRTFRASFARDVNFLIGPNGTGKTSVMNILRLVLQGDGETLSTVHFQKCRLEFEGDETLVFEVERPTETVADGYLKFSVSLNGGMPIETTESYNLADGRSPSPFTRLLPSRSRPSRGFHLLMDEVASTWVSVHRHEHTDNALPSYAPAKPPVDLRLEDITKRMTQYLAQHDAEAYKVLAEYQRLFFLSLIDAPADADVARFDFRQPVLMEQLTEVFKELGLEAEHYQSMLSDHFQRLEVAIEQSKSPRAGTAQIVLANHLKLIDLLHRYESVKSERRRIYAAKDAFCDILRTLYRGKIFFFTTTNQPIFAVPQRGTSDVDFIEPEALSSGEKQMFILLAEAVLQEERPYIYLADEPEISLHLEWQNGLVRNIRSINPNSQIVFATHSPEILAEFGERTIDMEKHTYES